MSEIKAGDLVIVTGGKCRHDITEIGRITRVLSVSKHCYYCPVCGWVMPITLMAELDYDGVWKPLVWLKKIDPPAEDTDTTEERHVTA